MKPESEIKLDHAQLFYKFSLGVRTLIDSADNNKVLPHLGVFSYLDHVVKGDEIKISRGEELKGASMLEHVAIYIMVLTLNEVLRVEWGIGRFESKDRDIQNISRVVELIRNAFAHDPFHPTWQLTDATRNKVYDIPGILTLKTDGLHGKRLDEKKDSLDGKGKDYGGQLALFRLLQHVREKLSH